jgi:hypothetical protein
MQPDVGLSVEGDLGFGVLELPQGQHDVAIRDEHGRIVRLFAYLFPAKAVDKKRAGEAEILDGKTYMINFGRE